VGRPEEGGTVPSKGSGRMPGVPGRNGPRRRRSVRRVDEGDDGAARAVSHALDRLRGQRYQGYGRDRPEPRDASVSALGGAVGDAEGAGGGLEAVFSKKWSILRRFRAFWGSASRTVPGRRPGKPLDAVAHVLALQGASLMFLCHGSVQGYLTCKTPSLRRDGGGVACAGCRARRRRERVRRASGTRADALVRRGGLYSMELHRPSYRARSSVG